MVKFNLDELTHSLSTFRFKGNPIPGRMHGGLIRYLIHGVAPGSFLRAVLQNDLKEAVQYADDTNLQLLPHYIAFLYNNTHESVYGSLAKYNAWIAAKQAEQAPAEEEG